jgi:hypothetical protein
LRKVRTEPFVDVIVLFLLLCVVGDDVLTIRNEMPMWRNRRWYLRSLAPSAGALD